MKPYAKARDLLQKGIAAYMKGRFSVAAKKTEAARKLFEGENALQDLANCENFLGNTYKLLGEPELALHAYDRAFALHKRIGDPRGQAADLGNTGAVYQDVGDLEQAEKYALLALDIYKELGKEDSIANQLGNLGNIRLMQGDLSGALTAYERVTRIHQEKGDAIGEATGLENQATVLRLLGDFSTALDLQRKALSLVTRVGDRQGEAECQGALGLIFQNQGDLKQALQHYDKALAVRQEIGDPLGEVRDLINSGNVHRDLGNYDQAIQMDEMALKIADRRSYRRERALLLADLGLVYQKTGDLERALLFQNWGIEGAEAIGDPEVLWRLFGGRGDTYSSLGKLDSAYQDYLKAVQEVEIVRKGLTSERHRLGYLREERLVDYGRLTLLLVDRQGLYRPVESFEWVEQAKARTFLDLLEGSLTKVSRFSLVLGESTEIKPGDFLAIQSKPLQFSQVRSLLI